MIIRSRYDTEQAFKLWRKSIHDYKHNIIVLKKWLEEGRIKDVREFIEKENELMAQKMFYIKTGNGVVDAIVNTKQNLAEEKGIKFSIHAKIPDKCILTDMDMACILGNLIDNAIEACENQKTGYIEIIITERKKNLIIKVVNSFYEKLPDKMNSTKENSMLHGIGVKSVKNIVAKYNGKYEMIYVGDEVITTIMILNKEY